MTPTLVRKLWWFVKCCFRQHPRGYVTSREAIFGYADRHHYHCTFCGDRWTV
jgi:hypothetical protein